MTTQDEDRAAGVLLGLACGDALGRPVEFETAAQISEPFGRIPEGAGVDLEGCLPVVLQDALANVPDDVKEASLSTSGYVVDTLQTALYDGLTAGSAEDAIVTAVNRGGDTDTVGAVAGAVAGARFGKTSLPDRWLETIERSNEIERLSRELAAHPHHQ